MGRQVAVLTGCDIMLLATTFHLLAGDEGVVATFHRGNGTRRPRVLVAPYTFHCLDEDVKRPCLHVNDINRDEGVLRCAKRYVEDVIRGRFTAGDLHYLRWPTHCAFHGCHCE